MVDPFQEISFLTRSENRVELLATLSEDSYTAYELVEETGISDVTAGRILEDFEERGWIREADDRYTTTRLGDMLAADYGRLADSMEIACRLGPVIDLLPVEDMDFDFRHLVDARISDPDRFEPLRAVDRWKELVRQADRIVGIAPAANATGVVIAPFHEAITEDDLQFEAVVSEAYFETAHQRPDISELLREILQAGAELYLAQGVTDFPVAAATFDDIATITAYDDNDNLRMGIESRTDPIHDWVRDTYESYRADAVRLDPSDFDV